MNPPASKIDPKVRSELSLTILSKWTAAVLEIDGNGEEPLSQKMKFTVQKKP